MLEKQTVVLGKLLKKIEAAPKGSQELDRELASVFPSTPYNVTSSIDAVVQLIETELPGWWWTCGYCSLSNDASFYVPGSTRFPYAKATMAPDSKTGPKALELLNDPKWGERFDRGFHRDRRGGTVHSQCWPLSWKLKSILMKFQSEDLNRRTLKQNKSAQRSRSKSLF